MARKSAMMLIIASVVSLAATGCLGEPEPDLSLERLKQTGKLVIGIDPSYPPFEGYDEKGQLVGYDVDLSAELASRLGAQPSFVAIDMGGIIDALIAKKIDVIISSLSPYPEYSKQLAYSHAYFDAGQVIVVRADSTEVTSVDDLKGKAITLESGSGADLEMSKHTKRLEGSAVRPMMTAQQALSEVREGRADAAVVDAISALEFVRSNQSLKIAGRPITDEPFVIAVRRQDQALLKAIDRILAEMQADGSLDRLQKKWL